MERDSNQTQDALNKSELNQIPSMENIKRTTDGKTIRYYFAKHFHSDVGPWKKNILYNAYLSLFFLKATNYYN